MPMSARIPMHVRSFGTRPAAAFESLEERLQFAVTAAFDPQAATLNVTGDALDNQIVLSRDAAGVILVNGGAVPVAGGTPTVANVTGIRVSALDGRDVITVADTVGAPLPPTVMNGGAGDDVLVGGNGRDVLIGEDG